MKLEVLSISCVSATLEIKYDEENVFYPHYSKKEYDLYLNDSFIRRDNKNVFTLHDLKPDSSYTVKSTHLKCTLQQFLVYSQGFVPSPQPNFRLFLSLQTP